MVLRGFWNNGAPWDLGHVWEGGGDLKLYFSLPYKYHTSPIFTFHNSLFEFSNFSLSCSSSFYSQLSPFFFSLKWRGVNQLAAFHPPRAWKPKKLKWLQPRPFGESESRLHLWRTRRGSSSKLWHPTNGEDVLSKLGDLVNQRRQHHFIWEDIYGRALAPFSWDHQGLHLVPDGYSKPDHAKCLEVPVCLLHTVEDGLGEWDEHSPVL